MNKTIDNDTLVMTKVTLADAQFWLAGMLAIMQIDGDSKKPVIRCLEKIDEIQKKLDNLND